MSTVCAPASPPGRGAVSLVRATGPGLRALLLSRLGRIPSERRAVVLDWKDRHGRLLDHALVVFFAGPRSYTGEDLLEISLHGNPLLVREVLDDLHASGIPLAAPGEFTRRAVENGKLDLSSAESVGALVAAETEDALEASRRILSGALRARIAPLRESLVALSARLELEVDFAEEEAAPGGEELLPWIRRAREALSLLCAAQDRLRSRGHAPRAVLAGKPNAGKSSLANALLGEDRLLVSPVAGTTRDWVEIPIHTPAGILVLVDTAGLGHPSDGLDALAQDRTRTVVESAPLRVVTVEAGRELSPEEAILAGVPGAILVRTKSDLHPCWSPPPGHLGVSSATGQGLDALLSILSERIQGDRLGPDEIALVGERQRQAADRAGSGLDEAALQVSAGHPELAAWAVRQAVRSLSELLGEIPPDEILASVFSSFCIGK